MLSARPGRATRAVLRMRGCPDRSICTPTRSVSDGTETPAELIAAAVAAGLGVVAITDHDSTAGWDQAFVGRARHRARGGARASSCRTQLDYASVHMLGYLVDPRDPELVPRRPPPSAPNGCTGPRRW